MCSAKITVLVEISYTMKIKIIFLVFPYSFYKSMLIFFM